MIDSLNNTKTKPLKRRLNWYVHLQRAGEDESPAERSTDKWIAEGEVNGEPQVSETCAYVTRQKM